ncbi:hypothetical protein HDV00_000977 [Rhizophlyctis rosea]|nr:hypothetical protein HDV00_000977 [Rhizophlyctis rosea]
MCATDKSTVRRQGPTKPLVTREEITERVEKGETIVIIHNKVYNLTKWIKFHPGGDMAIRHLSGKDATDAFLAFHPLWVIDDKLPHFHIADLHPDSRRTSKISLAYRKLEAQLHADGWYKTNYWFFAREVMKFFCMWAGMVYLAVWGPKHWLSYTVSALLGASLWHQAAFVAHDAGHSGISHDAKMDTTFGVCLGNFMGGLSLGWWKYNHNVHHIVTNNPEHDPDIQHVPFFAVSARFLENLYSSYYNRVMEFDAAARIFIPVQHYLYYVILCFGRFNLYVLSWQHLLSSRKVPLRGLEITGLCTFWVWYLAMLSALPSWGWIVFYIALSHMATMFLHLQITLSHFGMGTEDPPGEEEFAAKALRTTMDIECPRWMDWFHGGLQYQVEHHLFPRIPRHNLRALQPIVKQFAKDNGLPFHSYGFIRGNGVVLNALKDVADQVKVVLRVDPKTVHVH